MLLICLGGIERVGRARLRREFSPRPQSMTWPPVTDEMHIMTTGIAGPGEDAFGMALSEMILRLEEDYGFSKRDAHLIRPDMEGRMRSVRQSAL